MAEHTSGNFSFKTVLRHIWDGDTISGGNYSQLVPGTVFCEGVKNVTVTDGNFVNCSPPESWTIKGGNWAQISRCSHEHPDWVDKGLAECAVDCPHRQGTEKQWVETVEKEFRTEHNSIAADKIQVRIVNSEDADGVRSQVFEKQIFVYADKVEQGTSSILRHGVLAGKA